MVAEYNEQINTSAPPVRTQLRPFPRGALEDDALPLGFPTKISFIFIQNRMSHNYSDKNSWACHVRF